LNYATIPTTTLAVCSLGSRSDCCVIQVNAQYEVTCSGDSVFKVKPGTVCGFDYFVVGFPTCERTKHRCRNATQQERDAGLCDLLDP
jgi:hypothetical protein